MPKTTKKSVPKGSNNFLAQANITSAISYFPYLIGAITMYFLAEDKKATLHHVKYSAMMAVAVIVLIFVLNPFFAGVLNLAYWAISFFFAWKAYNGEEVSVEILDKVEEEFNKKIKK